MKNVPSLLCICLCVLFAGCGPSKEEREQKAANQRVNDLEDTIKEKTKQYEALLAQYKNNADEKEKVYEQKMRVLQNELTDYRLKLSVSEKTRLSLQAVVDQPERIANAKKENYTYERMVWLFLIMIAVGLAAYAFWKYTLLRNQRRENINALIAEFTKREASL